MTVQLIQKYTKKIVSNFCVADMALSEFKEWVDSSGYNNVGMRKKAGLFNKTHGAARAVV